MRLTTTQRKVIACTHLNARASIPDISKQTGLRQHTVRYALKGLVERGIIIPYTVVNVFALGYDDYGVFIRRITESESERATFLAHLKRSGRVSWIAELGGLYHYVISVLARNAREVDDFLAEVGTKLGQVLKGRAIAPRIRWEMYSGKFLSPGDKRPKSVIACAPPSTLPKVDKEDLLVLRALSAHAGEPFAVVARAVGMPITSLQYRIQRLLREKIVLGFAYHLNYNALGLRKSLLLIHERGCDGTFARKFEEYCRRHPAITCCLRSLANWTYELDTHTERGDELIALRQEILENFGPSIAEIENLEYLVTHKLVPFPGDVSE